MMLQLLHAGVLERQSAVLMGDFSQYRLGSQENGYDFDAMLGYLRERLDVPILTGLPFGHIRARATLPCGAMARLVSYQHGFDLTLSDYPTLQGAR